MTASQPKRPPPPDGWASWLNYLLQLSRPPALLLQSHWTATVGELAELRRALADAERERDEAKADLLNLRSDYREDEKELNLLRAQEADLRAERDSLLKELETRVMEGIDKRIAQSETLTDELAELRQALADAERALDDLREVLMCPACDYDPPTHRCGRCDSEVSYGD